MRRDYPELLRLRNQVTQLRQERESDKHRGAAQSDTALAGRFISARELTNIGFATAEAALQSFTAALASGDFEQVLAAMPEEERKPTDRAQYEEGFRTMPPLRGIQMIAKKVLSDDKVEIQVLTFLEGKPPNNAITPMFKVGNEWRCGGSRSGFPWNEEGKIELLIPE